MSGNSLSMTDEAVSMQIGPSYLSLYHTLVRMLHCIHCEGQGQARSTQIQKETWDLRDLSCRDVALLERGSESLKGLLGQSCSLIKTVSESSSETTLLRLSSSKTSEVTAKNKQTN